MKKRNWDAAIGEYKQLADLDQSNPNIYNELGDLYLKVNGKAEAIKSYERAVEAYTRVGLLNNAVAVCKKLLRFQTSNIEIFAQLGGLRKKQGFLKEATTYYLAYVEKLVLDVSIEPDSMKEKIIAVADEMHESTEVLETVVGYLLKWQSNEDGIQILKKLLLMYEKSGKDERTEEVKNRLRELGVDEETLTSTSATEHTEDSWSEDKLWTKSPMTEGERIEVDQDMSLEQAPLSSSEQQPQAAQTHANSAQDYGSVELKKPDSVQADSPSIQANSEQSKPVEPIDPPPAEEEEPNPGNAATNEKALSEEDVWIPDDDVPEQLSEGTDDNGGKVVHVSQIIDEFKSEIKESVDEEDYRSHYDLGMAYLEMDFLAEAIQEFQFAAKSDAYRVRSLEMIGMCFLNQGQPQLAIKQLRKGLELAGESDRETLGLLYNLGLAYEKIGEIEKARSCFEDVYVVDVTFRNVAEKMNEHSS
jgi:tetratricopeptide (TPR) repeat protein